MIARSEHPVDSRDMGNAFMEPEYYLARCSGCDYEDKEAAEFHSQKIPSDRDIVCAALEATGAPDWIRLPADGGQNLTYGTKHGDVVHSWLACVGDFLKGQ